MSLHDLERAESEFFEREFNKVYRNLYPAELPRYARAFAVEYIAPTRLERVRAAVRRLRWRLGRTVGRWLAGVELVDDTDDE